MAELISQSGDDFRNQVLALCAGVLDVAAVSELDRRLMDDLDLRREYLRILRQVSDCQLAAMPDRLQSVNSPISKVCCSPVLGSLGHISFSFSRPVFWSMLAASILFVAYFTAISWNMWGREKPIRPEIATHETDPSTKSAVAKISDAGGAVWANESAAKWNENAVTANEPLKIESGTVRLTLKQGTLLIVEAPSEWSVTGDNQARLKSGKVYAHVPPQATGFTLDTPTAHIVDLGTEFSTVVSKSGETSLYVVKGKVELARNTPRDTPQRFAAGESAKVSKMADGTAVVERIPFDVKQVAAHSVVDPLDRWRAASEKLRTDPSLLAYYDFEGRGDSLQNKLADELHGKIITALDRVPWTDGRWRGKGGLAFGADFAGVRVDDNASFTPTGDFAIAIWFRADAFPRTYALIAGKGVLPMRPYCLWLRSNGQLHWSHAKELVSQPVRKGDWNFAVAVFEAGKKRLYLNGDEACPPQTNKDKVSADPQPLTFGFINDPKAPYSFKGVIDEVAIFGRAPSGQEINDMYEAGKPTR